MIYPSIKLADKCDLITKGTTPTSLGFDFTDSGIPFIRAQNLVDGTVSVDADPLFIDAKTHAALRRSTIKPNDVLISIAGTIGRAAIVPPDALEMNCNQAVAIVRAGESIDRRFLLHWLNSQDAVGQIARGKVTGTISNLSLGQIGALEIPLPPLEEQNRIAAILDQADALRRLRARALTRLNALGQAIFHEMFGRKATSPLKRIAEFADVKGGKRLPKGSDYSDEVTPHPYIRVSDLGDLKIDTSAIKYISPEIQKSVWRYTVSQGDVVISIAGSIGLTAAVPESLNGANLTENAAKITPKKGVDFDPTYLSWALSMPEAKAQILASTGQVTIGKLALFRIEQIEVPMPTIERQRAFAAALRQVASEADAILKGSIASDALFTSLQHRAFRGEL